MQWQGRKVLRWAGRAAIKRHAQTLPHAGEKEYIISRAGKWYLMRWVKWYGLAVVAVADAPSRSFDPVQWVRLEE